MVSYKCGGAQCIDYTNRLSKPFSSVFSYSFGITAERQINKQVFLSNPLYICNFNFNEDATGIPGERIFHYHMQTRKRLKIFSPEGNELSGLLTF